MRMKTYQANSVQEALLKVKNELGPEAVILKTEKKQKNFLNKKKVYYEITAALDEKLFVGPENKQTVTEKPATYNREKVMAKIEGKETAPKTPVAVTPAREVNKQINETKVVPVDSDFRTLKKEIREMIKNVGEMKTSLDHMDLDQIPVEFLDVYKGLLENDFDEDLSRELIRKLGQIVSITKRTELEFTKKVLGKIIANRITVAPEIEIKPGRPTVIMLVGPTGVGKTTTIAKLSGIYKYEKHLDVGIISTDAQRMGAVEQMSSFCEAADIPLETVFSPEDFKTSLKNLSGNDVIFVDTAGSTKSDPESWNDLNEIVAQIEPDQVHLVLSSNVRTKDLKLACKNYSQLGATNIIFTKLDESLSLGNIYNIGADVNMPVSYLCNGQKIPDNILKADSEEISRMILEDLFEMDLVE